MRLNIKAFVAATAIEFVLVVLAMFGGPHGALGAWPWLLQMPGALALAYLPGDGFDWPRVVIALAVQLTIWYFICRGVLRRIRS